MTRDSLSAMLVNCLCQSCLERGQCAVLVNVCQWSMELQDAANHSVDFCAMLKFVWQWMLGCCQCSLAGCK